MASINKNRRGRWNAQIYLGRHPETGKTRWITQTFDGKRAAERWAKKIEGQRDDGSYKPTASKLTLTEYIGQQWLPAYRHQVRSTYNIEKTLGKWILNPPAALLGKMPLLGKVPLTKLTAQHFDGLYNAMVEQGMGARGISYLHGTLRHVLKTAVTKGELIRNPMDGVDKLPKPEAKAEVRDDDEDAGPVQHLTAEQMRRVLEAAKHDRFRALWFLLYDGALRPGEAFGLKWKRVDDKRAVVKIRGTLTRLGVKKAENEGRGWRLTDPKTTASKGDVPVTEETLVELKHWKAEQAEQQLKAGPAWHDHGFVFTTESGSPLGNNMGRAWAKLLASADGGRGDLGTWGPAREKPKAGPTPQREFTPRFSMYVLRHTRLTLMHEGGADIAIISRLARHKNITITAKYYVHTKATDAREVAAASFKRLLVASAVA